MADRQGNKIEVKPSLFACLFGNEKWSNYLKHNNLCKQNKRKRKKERYSKVLGNSLQTTESSIPLSWGSKRHDFKKQHLDEKARTNNYPGIGCSFYCSLEPRSRKEKYRKSKIDKEEISTTTHIIVVDESEGQSAQQIRSDVSTEDSHKTTEDEFRTAETDVNVESKFKMPTLNEELIQCCAIKPKTQSKVEDRIPVETETEERKIKLLCHEENSEFFEDPQLTDCNGYHRVPRSESMKNEIIPLLINKRLSSKRRVSFTTDSPRNGNEDKENSKDNDSTIKYMHKLDNGTNKKEPDYKNQFLKIVEKLTNLETKLEDVKDGPEKIEEVSKDMKQNKNDLKTATMQIQTHKKKSMPTSQEDLSSESQKIFENCSQISHKILKDCDEYYKIYYSSNKN